MKIKEFIQTFSLIPLKRGQAILATTTELFFRRLVTVTETNFDLIESFNVSGTKYKYEYQSQINGSSFKLRRIQKPGYKSSLFVGTIVYGKITKSADHIIVRYFATFNIFTNIIFVLFLSVGIYGAYVLLNSGFKDYSIFIMFLLVYLVFLILFDSEAQGDIDFAKDLTESFSDKTIHNSK